MLQYRTSSGRGLLWHWLRQRCVRVFFQSFFLLHDDPLLMEELHGLALSDQSDNHQRAEQDQFECIFERDPLSDHETADQGGEEDHAPVHDHGQQDGTCQAADHKPDQQHALDIQVEKVRDIQKNVGAADKTAGENEHFLQKYGESRQKTA